MGLLLVGFEQGAFKTKWGADVLVKPAFLIPMSLSYGGDTFTGTLSSDAAYCGRPSTCRRSSSIRRAEGRIVYGRPELDLGADAASCRCPIQNPSTSSSPP